jgi:hypothetical protein
MKMLITFLTVCMLICTGIHAETRSNGSVTMSSVGDDMLVILLHGHKKILMYKVNSQGACALKTVRTWHYDCQFANGLKTLYHSGTYPKDSVVDNKANGLKIVEWMVKQKYVFDPEYQAQGLGKTGSSSGGDLAVHFERSRTSSLMVILDSETYSLLLYEVNGQGVFFRSCRSILAEIQIPFYFPAKMPDNPVMIRNLLKGLEKAINKKKPEIPFVVKEIPEVKSAEDKETKDKKVKSKE